MTKWVYSFSAERAEGRGEMKNLLGGKGANLHEMASLGLPVPPGFTITAEVCTFFYANGKTYPPDSRRRSTRRWRRSRARRDAHSATRPTRSCFRCAQAPAPRCPA